MTTPLALDVPDAAEIVSVAPRLEARVTVFPETGLEFTSLRVTVSVEVVDPFAVTDIGLAAKVLCAAVTPPAVKVTVAV